MFKAILTFSYIIRLSLKRHFVNTSLHLTHSKPPKLKPKHVMSRLLFPGRGEGLLIFANIYLHR